MKKIYSLFAALIVAMFAFAQTATVTMTIENGKVIVTPTPADANVFCFGMDEAYYEFEDDFGEVDYLDYILEDYESANDVDEYCPAGAREICLSDWESYIQLGSNTVILAAVVAWDEGTEQAVRLSDVVRIDTTFTSIPTCDEGNTPTSGVTIEIVGGNAIVTPTPSDARVFFHADATENYEFSESYTAESFVNEVLGFYSTEDEFDAAFPQGEKTHCLADWAIEAGENTFVAAVVAWDAVAGKGKCLSEVVRVDKTFSEDPVCDEGGEEGGEEGDEDEPTLTVESGKYYVSTFMDDTTQYLLTTRTGSATTLPATLYADANTPTAANEFNFVAVDGQDGCFTIQDSTNAFMTVAKKGWSTTIAFVADKPETGAVWKVTLQDALNHVTIESTDFMGDLHCMNIEGTIVYCFGTEATGTYDLPILIKVPGASTNLQETNTNRQVIKTIENGQLILNINGVRYNILGIAL